MFKRLKKLLHFKWAEKLFPFIKHRELKRRRKINQRLNSMPLEYRSPIWQKGNSPYKEYKIPEKFQS